MNSRNNTPSVHLSSITPVYLSPRRGTHDEFHPNLHHSRDSVLIRDVLDLSALQRIRLRCIQGSRAVRRDRYPRLRCRALPRPGERIKRRESTRCERVSGSSSSGRAGVDGGSERSERRDAGAEAPSSRGLIDRIDLYFYRFDRPGARWDRSIGLNDQIGRPD